MNNWFYASSTGQNGPVDEDTFRELAHSGEITADTLVWHSGMTDWQPLRIAAPDLCATPPAMPGDPADSTPGDSSSFGDLKRHAKAGLQNNLGTFLCAVVLLWLILFGAQFVPFLGTLVASFLLAPIVEFGVANLCLRATDRRTLEIADGFVGFQQQFGRALAVYWTRCLYLFLWSLPVYLGAIVLVVAVEGGSVDSGAGLNRLAAVGAPILAVLGIPAMIKALSYSMATFLMIDNPAMTAKEAITASRALMNGQKLRLVLFHLSFLGWWLLVLVTFGLAALWVGPYEGVAQGAFYRSLRHPESQHTP
jgi:uncharacterized membrane protein